MRFWLLGIFFLLISPFSMNGQTKVGVLDLFSTSRGGAVTAVLGQKAFLYVAEGSSLVVYDTREPIYRRAFEHRFKGAVTDLKIKNGFLYLANGHEGLTKWDLGNPLKPLLVGAFELNDFETAFWSISFHNDSILVAADQAVWILEERNSISKSFEKVGEFGQQHQNAHIVAGTSVGSFYLAAVIGKEKGSGQGIHIFDISTGTRLNFVHYSDGIPAAIFQGQMPQTVWVFGGAQQGAEAHCFSISIEDPKQPKMLVCDTILSANGKNSRVGTGIQDDQWLWMPCSGSWGNAATPYFLLLKNTELSAQPSQMRQFPIAAAPLWLCKSEDRLHVACGAAGLRSFQVMLQDGMPERLSEIGQSRLNGGFCLGADAFENQLLTADEAAGFSLHLIQDRKTICTKIFDRVGTVRQVRFHSSGKYAICWVPCEKGDSLIVVELEQGKIVKQVEGAFGSRNICRWGDRMVCARDDQKGFDIIDVSIPESATKERSVLINMNGMSIDNQGRLWITTEHNLRAFDLRSGFTEIVSYAKYGEGFQAIAAWDEHVYVATRKRGLLKAKLVKDGKKFVFTEEFAWKMPHRLPEKMVVDQHGLYLGYEKYGVYALSKISFETLGYYRTSLFDPRHTENNLQDLFCHQGKICIVESAAQVTILRRNDQEE